jgi:hypothetical protein
MSGSLPSTCQLGQIKLIDKDIYRRAGLSSAK